MDERTEAQFEWVAQVQRGVGWSDLSIQSYKLEILDIYGQSLPSCVTLGTGLAQDNSRHGVFN